jgi:hypothetical protein
MHVQRYKNLVISTTNRNVGRSEASQKITNSRRSIPWRRKTALFLGGLTNMTQGYPKERNSHGTCVIGHEIRGASRKKFGKLVVFE